MTRSAHRPTPAWRRAFLALAMLAVALKVLIPAGFMARTEQAAPFPLVLCTSQGAVVADAAALGHDSHEDQPAKSHHDSPCAFAGHGLGAAPPTASDAEVAVVAVYERGAPALPASVSPGRGVSGPPLPARGPPSLLL